MLLKPFRLFFSALIKPGQGSKCRLAVLIKRYGGSAIGVCDPEVPSKWEKARLLVTDDRGESVCAADYHDGAGLHRTLHKAVKDIAQRIAARKRETAGVE